MTPPASDLEFVREHADFVRALARELVFDRELARDVEQETWLAALQNSSRGASPRAWLAALVRHIASKAWRAKLRRGDREFAAALTVREVPTPAELLERESLRREIVDAVIALDEPWRSALIARYFANLSPQQAAQRLGVPLETLRTRLKRARELLRARLEGRRGEFGATLALALVRGLQLEPPSYGAAAKAVTKTLIGRLVIVTVAKKFTVACVAFVVLAAAALLWSREDAAGPRAVSAPKEVSAALADVAPEQPAAESRRGVVSAPDGSKEPAETNAAAEKPTTGELLVRVTWFDGSPAADVGLCVMRTGAENFERNATLARTDGDGVRRFQDIEPGLVIVQPDRGGYGSIPVAAGAHEELAITIPRGADIEGLVTDALDRPVAGADVFLHTDRGGNYEGFVVARSDEQGRFAVRSVVEHSGACISARARGRAPTSQNIIATTESTLLRVHLVFTDGGGSFSGHVLDEQGRAVAGATVLLGKEDAYGAAEFADGSRGYEPCAQLTTTSAGGQFEFSGVALGATTLQVRARGFAPWRGEVDPTHESTTEIRLGRSATLRGTVVDAARGPVFGALVMVGDPYAFNRVIVRTERDGSYVAHDAPLGEVEVIADGIKRGQARTRLSIAPGAELEWNAVLEEGLSLAGHIVVAGRDLSGWLVHVYASDGEPEPYVNNAETDADGRFVFTGVPDQPLDLLVHVPGDFSFPVATLTDVRPGGGELAIEIDLAREPSVRIVGRVVDANGNPLAGAELTPTRAHGGGSRSYTADDRARFEVGPLPPDEWSLEVRARGFAPLRTPPRSVAARQTLDVGDVAVDLGGTLAVHAQREAGSTANVVWLCAEREDGMWKEWLELVDGTARSGPLSAGRWRVVPHDESGKLLEPLLAEVRAGTETRVELVLRAP